MGGDGGVHTKECQVPACADLLVNCDWFILSLEFCRRDAYVLKNEANVVASAAAQPAGA